ncbi:MAG: hypothetical protein JO145_00770 [Acidobacteriaceae bacterium]|nr:hypothetical protein [Acidobacteriaceae bacterium]
MEERRGSTEIADFGGISTPAPGLAIAFMIAMLASIGLPTLCNFIGEYLVLQGAAITKFSWAVWAALGVILSAVYMLWMYQRTFWGKTTEKTAALSDLNLREWAPLLPLIALMVWLGTYTQSFMPPITAATSRLLDQTSMNNEYRVQVIPPPTIPVMEARNAR